MTGWPAVRPDDLVPTRPGGTPFSDLVAALREAQEVVTGARPDPATAARAAGLLRQAAEVLGAGVGEDDRLAGRLWEEPGRGQALAPAVHVDEVRPHELLGRVTFGRFHAGSGAVHGGVLPLVFDEVMARLANSRGRPRARTAYLRTDYRAVVPIGVEVRVRSWLVAEEGRKRTARAELRLDGRVLAEAEGLWVALRPGQP